MGHATLQSMIWHLPVAVQKAMILLSVLILTHAILHFKLQNFIQCIGTTFHTIITFHTNRKSLSFLHGSLQKLFCNMVYANSICAQSLKLLQPFDEAGHFQEWYEKHRFV
jgi:hypothetical protein